MKSSGAVSSLHSRPVFLRLTKQREHEQQQLPALNGHSHLGVLPALYLLVECMLQNNNDFNLLAAILRPLMS